MEQAQEQNKYNLFLDDFRIPVDAFQCTGDTDFLQLKWAIVRSHDEFVDYIQKRYDSEGVLPDLIAFDHDLADDHYEHVKGEFPYDDIKEKTGYRIK